MKTYKIILLLFINNLINAQITFEKTYGGAGQDFAASCIQTKDNGYVILGSSDSFTGSTDLYLIKTDLYGNITWSNTNGGSSINAGEDIKETNDSGFVIIGNVNFQTQVIKTNKTGSTKWIQTYPGYGPLRISQTQDSGYAIVGTITIAGSNRDLMLIKTDSLGNTIWLKKYGFNTFDYCGDFKQTNDGGYVLAGCRTINWIEDIYIVKTNSLGDTLWTKSYGGPLDDHSYSVAQTTDSGYIILGGTGTFSNYKPYLIKTDQYGDTLWTKKFNFGCSNNGGNKIIQTPDGGYAFIGETNQSATGYQIYMVKLNTSGDTLWTKVLTQGYGMSIQNTNDGGFIVCGYTQQIGAGANDIYLAKIDNMGVMTDLSKTINNGFKLAIFPNPAKNSITISQTQQTFNKYEIYSLNGKLIADNKISSVLQKVDLTGYAEGMYIVKLIGAESVEFKKIVVVE